MEKLRNWRAHWREIALVALLILIGAATLCWNLAGTPFLRWDESAYSGHAMNALHYGDYLLPLDTTGHITKARFSKLPFAFWLVAGSYKAFGISMVTLRLPFALATLSGALACYVWARTLVKSRLLGMGWGAAAAAGIVRCDGSLDWGRKGVIEPLLVCFMMWALVTHTLLRKRGGVVWPMLIPGTFLALAFFTKQAVVGFAILPLIIVELGFAPFGRWRGFRRLLMLAVPLVTLGASWFIAAYSRIGHVLFDTLFGFGLQQRFAGFQGTVHFNTLNRVAATLDTAMNPLQWELGLAGLLLFFWHQRNDEKNERIFGLIPLIYVVTVAMVLEFGTKSLLAWYVYNFVPVLALGYAWPIARLVQFVLRPKPSDDGTQPVSVHEAATGAIFFVAAVSNGLPLILSQFSIVMVAIFLVVAGPLALRFLRTRSWLQGRSWLQERLSFRDNAWRAPVVVCALLAFSLTACRSPFLCGDVKGAEGLMGVVGARGIQPVAVDPSFKEMDPKAFHLGGMFGPLARFSAPPWKAKNFRAKAYVDRVTLPNELHAEGGEQEIIPVYGGGTAYLGDLSSAPYTEQTLAALLEKGPLTFEAEYSRCSHPTITWDRKASGHYARAYKTWLSQSPLRGVLTDTDGPVLPAGKYQAKFFMRRRCFHPQAIGSVTAMGHSLSIQCPPRPDPDYIPFTVNFDVREGAPLTLRVTTVRGHTSLWHDRTEIRRIE